MKPTSVVAVVIFCFAAEALAASSDKHRQHHPSRQRGTRQLPEYLRPPPHIGGPSPSPAQHRPPTSKPRGHHHPPPYQNHQQKPELSKSLAQRVARWFFDSGNEQGQATQNFEIKQSPPWLKSNYGPPKPPRNFHGPPKPLSVYGPSRPPSFRSSNRPPQFLGPPRPGYGPPPPHTLNLPQNSNHGRRPEHQYLPLTPPSSDSQGRCNPCNKVPWVPLPHTAIAGSPPGIGQGFRNIDPLPLEGFGNGHGTPEFPPFSGPSANDRPLAGPPDSSYGPPHLPHVAPGPPFNSGHSVSGPSDSYGQPLQSPSNQYGPPYPSSSDHQDIRQGNSPNQNTFGGQSYNKQHSNELAININEQFGYGGGHDPLAAATQHESQDGSVHLVPETGSSVKFRETVKPLGGHNDDVEVVKSVRVADFLASVEYPLEVIQSPVIDIDQQPNNSGNDNQKPTTPHHDTQSAQVDLNNVQSNRDSGRQQGSNYGNNNENQNNNHNADQKEQQATVHQVVSTANGKIIKGRPIVVDSFVGEDSEENKVNTARPQTSKGLTNLTPGRDYYNKITTIGENKYQDSGESIGFQTGTTIFDLTPSLQTQAQGTSLIHNINNLNIFTQQLPPSAPFTNNFQQRPSHVNYPLGVNTNKPLSSPSPFHNNFQHPSLSAPIDVLTDINLNQQSFNTQPSDLKPNLVTSPPLDTSSWIPVSSTVNSQTTWSSKPIGKPVFSFLDSQGVASFNNAGMLPPPLPRPYQASKKPKQIQVIIPYTSSKQLLDFQSHKRPAIDNTGWLPLQLDDEKFSTNQARKVPPTNCSTTFTGQSQWQKCKDYTFGTDHTNPVSQGLEEDYHQHEESRTVTATIAQTPRPLTLPSAGGIHHIFAPNIRALLKGEEDRASPESLMFKLQKNIDEWTALEYSNGKGPEKIRDDERKGTTSLLHLLVPSKKIPDAYLTTTPSTFDDETSENMVATAVPSIKKNLKSNKIHVKSYHDHDVSGSNINARKTLPERNSTDKLKKNIELKSVYEIDEANKAEKNERRGNWGILEANLVVPEESTSTTSTTTESQTKTAQHTWGQLEMSISPITKEKVYVVTPMSVWNPETTPTPHHVYNRFLPQSHTKTSRAFNSSYHLQTTTYPSSTFDRDSFPFRNDATPRNKSFHSPRFLVRPTPGVNLQRTPMTSEKPGRSFSVEDNSVIVTHETNYENRKSTASIGPSSHPYSPPDGRVHTITGHSKVVTVPTTATSSRRKWTGYDAIRPTTPAPDDPEGFLQSLAKLLTSGNGVSPGETVAGSISAAVRGSQKNQEPS